MRPYLFYNPGMKTGLHPNYAAATVLCACGNRFETRSTRAEIKLEICSACHPFYTGQQRFLDTAGRVEKFKRKLAAVKAPRPKAAVKPRPLDAVPLKKILSSSPKKIVAKPAKAKDAAAKKPKAAKTP